MGQIVAPKSSRCNISGANDFVKLKINPETARDTLNIIAKFHSYNFWGLGRESQFGLPFTFSKIFGAKGFVQLNIDQRIDYGALSLSLKFHDYTQRIRNRVNPIQVDETTTA